MRCIYFIVMVLVVFVLSACQTEASYTSYEEPLSSAPLQTLPDLEGYINMSVSEIRPDYVDIVIQNYSDTEVITGLAFSLEVYNNGQWINVPFRQGYGFFRDIGFGIVPGNSIDLTKNMSFFQSVDEGLHRIRKSVFPNRDLASNGAIEELSPSPNLHEITAEFYIN